VLSPRLRVGVATNCLDDGCHAAQQVWQIERSDLGLKVRDRIFDGEPSQDIIGPRRPRRQLTGSETLEGERAEIAERQSPSPLAKNVVGTKVAPSSGAPTRRVPVPPNSCAVPTENRNSCSGSSIASYLT
jgi:hypothetical protein